MEEWRIKIHVVSLGCDKNLVDSEAMLGLVRGEGFLIVNDPEDADVIIVNTCGFIREAVSEGIGAVIESAEYKKSGVCKALIVTGCMVARYKDDILAELPEVDAVLGTDELWRITDVIKRVFNIAAQESDVPDEDIYINRVLSTHMGYAYLKIAEGCDNRCTYCTIPYIKGPYKSRRLESLLAEAENLADLGVRELVLVAQDTTLYGTDIYGKPSLDVLLRKLSEIPDIAWLRVMYAYPENITDALIDEIAGNNKICEYLDIPVQHASDAVLKRMGRRSTGAELRGLISRLRKAMPDIALRTTIMVGFPGESEADFKILTGFVEETRFDHLGVFAFSREEGSPAYKMRDQIPEKLKESRRGRILRKQAGISLDNNKRFESQTLTVLTEGRMPKDGGFVYLGRSYRDCPQNDGTILFSSDEEIMSGEFVNVLIDEADEHDLYGMRVYDESSQ
jgi:ribosomal protein S12 methylthiotransferase